MLAYNQDQIHTYNIRGKAVYSFVADSDDGLHARTVNAFGEEWQKFGDFSDDDIDTISKEYFDILPADLLTPSTVVLDAGCGSGRWSRYLAPKAGFVEAIDPSMAAVSAASNPSNPPNIRYTQASIQNLPFDNNSFDLIICLGVLHHTPDPLKSMRDLVEKLKSGGHLLVYIYYALETRGWLYRWIFKFSDLSRRIISGTPGWLKRLICDAIAIVIYWPLTRSASFLRRLGIFTQASHRWPLAYYQDKSMLILRNDALDRFGTPLEKRFTREETSDMMKSSGLANIAFSSQKPYWHALGQKP